MLSKQMYDILKWVAQYGLPGVSVLIFALSTLWGFSSEKVIGTVVAVETLLGVLLGVSSAVYNKDGQYKQLRLIGTSTSGIFVLPDHVYDTVKWIAQYALPGLATLYFSLSSIWGFPYGQEIMGTISALDIFLGVLLGISNENYKAFK